jgi:molecular chaperone HtpG
MCKTKRDEYEKLWDDLSPFIKYGCLKDEKFNEKMHDYIIYKNLSGKYVSLPEYLEAGKDKYNNKVFYVTDEQAQALYIQMFKDEEMDAIIMTHNIDNPFITNLEVKENADKKEEEQIKFLRIDSDVSENFKGEQLSEEDAKKYTEELTEIFKKALNVEKINIKVEVLKDSAISSILTQSEQERRMAEMMKMYAMAGMGGMDFGKESETLVLNYNNQLVKYVLDNPKAEITDKICCQLYDLAVLSNKPLSKEELPKFVERSNEILMMLAKNN